MKYITGIHALNIDCSLETCGDWHQSAIQWAKPNILESDESIFKDYGIEFNKRIPGHNQLYPVANHVRALLDLIDMGNFAIAQGMRDDFICNDKYTSEIFDLVWKLRQRENWTEIDEFMGREYMLQWIEFKRSKGEVLTINRHQITPCMEIHQKVIDEFLYYLNAHSNQFILKGGCALWKCYGLDRNCESVELDGFGTGIEKIISDFCQDHGYKYELETNSSRTKKFLVHYNNENSGLTIAISYRNKSLDFSDVQKIKGILVYSIPDLFIKKITTFMVDDRIRDLYDLCFMYLVYHDVIPKTYISTFKNALEFKGIECFEYIVETNDDDLVDKEKLRTMFFISFDSLGLRRDAIDSDQYDMAAGESDLFTWW